MLQKFSSAVKHGEDPLKSMRIELDGASNAAKTLALRYGDNVGNLTNLSSKLVGAKLKTVAMTAAQYALNAAMSMGLSVIIELVVSGLTMLVDNLIHADEKLLESAEAGNEAFQSISETAGGYRELKGSLESIAPRYIELSQGVGVLGANISLTDIEYAEFLSLSSELAALFPELVTGYDSNGNAMLNLSGDVETLSAAFDTLLEKQRQLANQEIADTLPTVLEGVLDFEKLNEKEIKKLREKQDVFGNDVNKTADISNLSFGTARTLADNFNKLGLDIDLKDYYHKNEYSGEVWYDLTPVFNSEEYKTALAAIDAEIEGINQQTADRWKQINPVADAMMQSDFRYGELNGEMQKLAANMVSGLDFSALGLETEEDVRNYITNHILNPLYNAGPEVKDAFSEMTNWKEQFAKGELSADEFKEKAQKTFKSLFDGMELDDPFRQTFVNAFQNLGFYGEVPSAIFNDIINDWINASDTTNNLAYSYSALRSELNLTRQAMQEQSKNGIISEETYQSLIATNSDYADMITKTVGGYQMNTEAVEKYNDAQRELQKIQAQYEQDMLAAEYQRLQEEIERTGDVSSGYVQSCIEEQEAVSERIAVYDQYIESLSDAAQAYEDFQNAQQTDDNSYLNPIQSAAESIREGIEEMRTGTDDYREAVNLIFGEDSTLDTGGMLAARSFPVWKTAKKPALFRR